MADKYVYDFSEGNKTMKPLLGGKGANLAEMTVIGLPVPPGFTITTEVCNHYSARSAYPEGLEAQVETALQHLEKNTGKRFGDPDDPLLVSVRSGARASMPGMMDTILNLGLNDTTIQGLIKSTNNPRFGYDCYRRFVSMYGDVVLGCKPESKDDPDPFEERLDQMKKRRGVAFDTELTADDLKELVAEFKAAVHESVGKTFPEDPREQLWGAVTAVFGSWMNDRAIAYRKLYDIPDTWGTAVNVQTMVYGNTGDESGTGVAFTRNPATGENAFYGEFLVNAQGEDVVSGVRTPRPAIELKEVWPDVYDQLMEVRQTLEREMRDMQDFEFTIERGRLFMLQTRNGKRTGLAAIRIAVDMADQGLIGPEEALMRIEPDQLNQLLRPVFRAQDEQAAEKGGKAFACGLPAGPGAATGRVVFSAADAVAWAERGEQVLLVRDFTSPEDIRGMDAAQGILTAQGGMTSHAALVARQMGKVCIVGCGVLDIDMTAREFSVDDVKVKEGDWISIDGFIGEVIAGQLETRPPEVLQVLLEGSHEARGERVVPLLLQDHGVGGRAAQAARPHQRRPARSGRQRDRLRRPGHRPVPHRAHVLRRRPHRRHARDDPGQHPRGAREGPRQAAAHPARRLRRHLPRHEGPAGDHPHARPAAARVPAARRRGPARGRRAARHLRRRRGRRGRRPPREQPHARPARLPPGHRLPGDHPHAGARHPRGRLRRQGRGRQRAPRDHDPAGRHPEGARRPGRRRCARWPPRCSPSAA